MTQILANGIQMHVLRMPAKGLPRADGPHPTVVFIHGLGLDSLASFYFTLAAPVAAVGIDVIAYDLRGHGRSGRPPAEYRLTDFVADLSGLLDALEVSQPVHLVGNSYGGTVAFSYALAHPERVASLFVIEAEPATESWSRKMSVLFDKLDKLDHPEEMAAAIARHGTYVARLGKETERLRATTIGRDLASGPWLSREQIQSVRCPMTAILGGESDFVDRAEFASLLPGCRIVVLPGHGHWMLTDTPRTVRDLLLPWIAEYASRVQAEGQPV